MNPCNGLCLNALHDKAFDQGLITITPHYFVRVAERFKKNAVEEALFFAPFDGKKIMLPQRFLPSLEFIEFHNKSVFIDK